MVHGKADAIEALRKGQVQIGMQQGRRQLRALLQVRNVKKLCKEKLRIQVEAVDRMNVWMLNCNNK